MPPGLSATWLLNSGAEQLNRAAPMTTYVDTSMLVKLIVAEAGTHAAYAVWGDARSLVAVSLIEVEAAAALAAAHRQGRLTLEAFHVAEHSLDDLIEQLDIIEVDVEVIERARKLAPHYALRGYDAVHLAAATLVGADVFTSADFALCEAAHQEGMLVANPLDR